MGGFGISLLSFLGVATVLFLAVLPLFPEPRAAYARKGGPVGPHRRHAGAAITWPGVAAVINAVPAAG